jgi:hypothetical protein
MRRTPLLLLLLSALTTTTPPSRPRRIQRERERERERRNKKCAIICFTGKKPFHSLLLLPPLLSPPLPPSPPPPLLSPFSTSAALAASLSTACATASLPTTSILATITGSRSNCFEASNSCRAERRSASRHSSPVGESGEVLESVLQVKRAVALQMER